MIKYDNTRILSKLGEQSETNFQYSVFVSLDPLLVPHKNKTIKL